MLVLLKQVYHHQSTSVILLAVRSKIGLKQNSPFVFREGILFRHAPGKIRSGESFSSSDEELSQSATSAEHGQPRKREISTRSGRDLLLGHEHLQGLVLPEADRWCK